MSKKRVKKLSIEWDMPFEYTVFGICSHHPDYRLVWGINEATGWQFAKADEAFVPNAVKGKSTSHHSFYEYQNEEERSAYFLIKNKGDQRLLMDEQPRIDYFLFVDDPAGMDVKFQIQQLNAIQSILATYHFEVDQLPSLKNITL